MFRFVFNALYPYVKPYKVKVFGAIFLSFVLAGVGAMNMRLLKPIFESGLNPESSQDEIIRLALILLGLGLINFPARFFHFYWIRFIVDKATCELRENIFKKLQYLPTSFFTKHKQGTMVSSILNDAHIFSNGFRACVDLLREPLKALAYLGMALYYDWQLTLVVVVITPFLIGIFNVSGKKVKNNQSHVQEDQAELTHNISEGIAGHKLSKAFNLQEFIINRFRKAQDKFFNSQMRTTFVEEMAHPFVEVVGTVAFSLVIIFAYFRMKDGLTVGEFIGFVGSLALLMDPIRKFSQANVKLSQAKAAGERIFKVLDLEEERSSGEKITSHLHKGIEVRDLSFSYGENQVLNSLSLDIPKGKKVALVGLSGSGKSTLINLLLGLYDVDRGTIKIDGKDINDINLKSLRDLYGLVSQDIFLFHDSIEENLKLGERFTDEQIKNSLAVSYADEYINQLPEGMRTVIGDRGARLSGGQQQRITIARAFLQNNDILLFDEATSALDNESEKIVQKAMESISGNKTVVAVAHRLTTIQNYDIIYVFKEGRVVQSGTHSELLSLDGEYKKLYELSSD